MSCRTTAAGSALTTLARLQSGLTDVQTLSAYHALRVEGRGTPRPSPEQWAEFITAARENVRTDPGFTDARRRSLMGRLDRAAEEYERIDGATWHALRNVSNRTWMQDQQVSTRLRMFARGLDEEYESIVRRYRAIQDEIDRSRTAEAPAGYSDEAVQNARMDGLPIDRGSIVAMRRLQDEVREVSARRALEGPQRIERQTFANGRIAEAGYDEVGGRLEVVFRRPDGNSRTYAYHGVPADVWTQMQSSDNPVRVYTEHVRNHADYRYSSQVDADLDSAARRCVDCGQYAATSHACPVRIERQRAIEEADRVAREARAAAARAEADAAARAESERQARLAEAEAAAARAATEGRPEPRDVYFRDRYRNAGSLDALRDATGRYDRANNDLVFGPRNLTEMRAEAQNQPIAFAVSYQGWRYDSDASVQDGTLPTGSFRVNGVAVYDRPRRGEHLVDLRDPRCSCPQYAENGDCPHINYAVSRLRSALLPAPSASSRSGTPVDPAVAQAAAEQALREDWMRGEETAAEARARWAAADQADGHYSTNFAAFEEDYQAALDRKAAGEEPVPYMTQSALGGLADPGSGRRFGIELEFDLPTENRSQALNAIGRELYDAGLTPSQYQQRYHSDSRTYFEHQRGWKFERDCTVTGEIISPAMEDTPETWENIAKVCDIVKRHGGKASVRTGSHVHVSSPHTTPGTAAELVRMANQHEDVMYRVSQNPDRGKHRPMKWCGPNADVSPNGYATIDQARRYNNSHGLGVNLQSVSGNEGDHAEIRHWDGTLNPGVIQSQIKVSVAMLAAAQRNGSIESPAVRGRERIGAHAKRLLAVRGRSRRALTSDELREDTATARSFADTLFTRREDKAQFAALFAVTKWNSVNR